MADLFEKDVDTISLDVKHRIKTQANMVEHME
jgi:hypothetical protein